MKAWVVSDFHVARADLLHGRKLTVPRADICICAGDISNDIERSIDFLHAEIAPHMPVVAVLGNHDYYGSSIAQALDYARKWSAGTNVHILEDQTVQVGDLRVVGSTLWTDFEIKHHEFGDLPVNERRELAARECLRHLLDFRLIFDTSGLIKPDEMMARHRKSLFYIDSELAKPFDGITMVLSHHAISPRSLDPRFAGHVSNAAFASDLTAFIRRSRPHFWVHGHIHRFADYTIGHTRVLCNPRGYSRETDSDGFRPRFVIETSMSGYRDGQEDD
ncbi:phosphohydrolase (plasmid) [Rhizobium leguminosarum]|uniref:metallophosphoesterase n=1 Tax=Rhizobium leguminosarum TaxID=384 RepID=UPI001030E270|nr:metallophosphoesterase [Rhizobium leguminosarum]TAY27681.1 phosphohydrolase [Rhizobium leguminosarum]